MHHTDFTLTLCFLVFSFLRHLSGGFRLGSILTPTKCFCHFEAYICDWKELDLPVCKIGMTSSNPHYRCSEINNSSTGDFIWKVAYYVAVDNCKKLESLVHKILEFLKQSNRKFFNIIAKIAYK